MAGNPYDIPLIVSRADENGIMNVIDGQHTLEVRKMLSKPVFYYVLPGPEDPTEYNAYCINALRLLNATNKTWTVWDFIKFYATEGLVPYQHILLLQRLYPAIATGVIYIKSYTDKYDWDNNKLTGESTLKLGRIALSDIDKAKKKCEQILDFIGTQPYKHQAFKESLLKMFSHSEYDHQQMKVKIKAYSSMLSPRLHVREYLVLLSSIYNRGKSKGLVYFDTLLDGGRNKK
jgi:hypothetical protein